MQHVRQTQNIVLLQSSQKIKAVSIHKSIYKQAIIIIEKVKQTNLPSKIVYLEYQYTLSRDFKSSKITNLGVEKLEFDIRIRSSSDVHFLQLSGFQYSYGEFARRWHIPKREANVAQILITAIINWCQIPPFFDGTSKIHGIQWNLNFT